MTVKELKDTLDQFPDGTLIAIHTKSHKKEQFKEFLLNETINFGKC